MPSIPAALVVARRAMVVAAAAMVIAALAVVVALLSNPESDPAESAALEQAQADAAAARTDAEAATAMAEAAAAIADAAAAKAAAVQQALAAALAEAGEVVDPEVIARLEAQLEEALTLAATALVAADAAASVEEAAAADATPEEGAAVEDAPESEEAATVEDAPAPEEAAAVEDAPVPEDEVTDAAVALPGEPFELGPSEGAALSVVGVSSDSALNVRDVPNGEIVARLDNVMDGVRDPAVYVREADSDDIITTVDLQSGIVATGNARRLLTTIWYEFRAGDLTGWSSASYLAQIGETDDATAEVVDIVGEIPVTDTMIELAAVVAHTMASQEPQSRVVVSEAPGIFEALAQMTVDVVDVGDDSILGFRLVIFAHPAEEDWTQENPGPFALKSVERTVLCHSHRGVSEEGLCL